MYQAGNPQHLSNFCYNRYIKDKVQNTKPLSRWHSTTWNCVFCLFGLNVIFILLTPNTSFMLTCKIQFKCSTDILTVTLKSGDNVKPIKTSDLTSNGQTKKSAALSLKGVSAHVVAAGNLWKLNGYPDKWQYCWICDRTIVRLKDVQFARNCGEFMSILSNMGYCIKTWSMLAAIKNL